MADNNTPPPSSHVVDEMTERNTGYAVVELDEACYNVAFDRGEHTHLHLGMQVTFLKATDYVRRFKDEYVGKTFPNGKGVYPFTNPRVVIVMTHAHQTTFEERK